MRLFDTAPELGYGRMTEPVYPVAPSPKLEDEKCELSVFPRRHYEIYCGRQSKKMKSQEVEMTWSEAQQHRPAPSYNHQHKHIILQTYVISDGVILLQFTSQGMNILWRANIAENITMLIVYWS